jgi:hypothetical protein
LVNCEQIQKIGGQLMECKWGRRFYGSDVPPGFLTDSGKVDHYLAMLEEEDPDQSMPQELFFVDIYDTVILEPYGPHIDPIDYADVVDDANCPMDQNCTVCAEPYTLQDGFVLCLKLLKCGHHVHYHCIEQWMNGVAQNSNLCPECRTEISRIRRPVRVAANIQPIRIDGPDIGSRFGARSPVHIPFEGSQQQLESDPAMSDSGDDEVNVHEEAATINVPVSVEATIGRVQCLQAMSNGAQSDDAALRRLSCLRDMDGESSNSADNFSREATRSQQLLRS